MNLTFRQKWKKNLSVSQWISNGLVDLFTEALYCLSCMRLQVSVTFSHRFSNILAEEKAEYAWRRWEAEKQTNKQTKASLLCCMSSLLQSECSFIRFHTSAMVKWPLLEGQGRCYLQCYFVKTSSFPPLFKQLWTCQHLLSHHLWWVSAARWRHLLSSDGVQCAVGLGIVTSYAFGFPHRIKLAAGWLVETGRVSQCVGRETGLRRRCWCYLAVGALLKKVKAQKII